MELESILVDIFLAIETFWVYWDANWKIRQWTRKVVCTTTWNVFVCLETGLSLVSSRFPHRPILSFGFIKVLSSANFIFWFHQGFIIGQFYLRFSLFKLLLLHFLSVERLWKTFKPLMDFSNRLTNCSQDFSKIGKQTLKVENQIITSSLPPIFHCGFHCFKALSRKKTFINYK